MKMFKSFFMMMIAIVFEAIATLLFLTGAIMSIANVLYNNGVNIFHVEWSMAIAFLLSGVVGWVIVTIVFCALTFYTFKNKP